MASKAAHKRLTKEYVAMQKEPPPFVWAAPDEKNILNWNFIIRGPPDSPFAGGEYHGMLMFPSEYPFKPPGIKMLTPSGRFQPDKKICFSMSDFHPGSWNPAWSVATILTGLLSFMLSDDITTGSINSSDNDKRALAARSHAWNIAQRKFKEAFPDHCEATARDLPNMGEQRGSTSAAAAPAAKVSQDALPSGSALTNAAKELRQRANQAQHTLNHGAPHAAPDPDAVRSWYQLIWEKWRWAVFLLFAVFVSRATS